ncbi:hypothetical protein B0T11DRAFT_136310 [Plectosphaerella cucumerina]|uniref:Uncharacterized protein n=1 Tax=Plectosphaerella cucumerina TaxID=40658 RepID=A0A8K0T6K1_9PEZI|nr:hypothetical protein B0T11DRAFT_136310 [Plectosphaerella cucumerina]
MISPSNLNPEKRPFVGGRVAAGAGSPRSGRPASSWYDHLPFESRTWRAARHARDAGLATWRCHGRSAPPRIPYNDQSESVFEKTCSQIAKNPTPWFRHHASDTTDRPSIVNPCGVESGATNAPCLARKTSAHSHLGSCQLLISGARLSSGPFLSPRLGSLLIADDISPLRDLNRPQGQRKQRGHPGRPRQDCVWTLAPV